MAEISGHGFIPPPASAVGRNRREPWSPHSRRFPHGTSGSPSTRPPIYPLTERGELGFLICWSLATIGKGPNSTRLPWSNQWQDLRIGFETFAMKTVKPPPIHGCVGPIRSHEFKPTP